jgi:hypothetical protein
MTTLPHRSKREGPRKTVSTDKSRERGERDDPCFSHRVANIAKGRVGFIEPMLAVAVTKLPEGAYHAQARNRPSSSDSSYWF